MKVLQLLVVLLVELACSGCSSEQVAGGAGGGGGAGAAGAGGSGGEGPAQLGEACETGDCDTRLFCDFPYHACTHQPPGVTGDAYSGACAARPESCAQDGSSSPVCGCDGVVYASACQAYLAGIDLGHESCGPEVTPAGHFPCGTLYCDPTAEWCWVGLGDVGDVDYQCRPLPAACGAAPDCACLENEALEAQCSVVQGHGVSGLRVEEPLI